MPVITPTTKFNKGRDTASTIVDGQTLIIAPKKLFVLNTTGTKIWEMCDGDTSLYAIVNRLAGTSRKTRKQLEKETLDFIGGMLERGVLEIGEEVCKRQQKGKK